MNSIFFSVTCLFFECRDLVEHGLEGNASKIVVLTDCQSSVGGFEEMGDKFFNDMKEAGATMMASDGSVNE